MVISAMFYSLETSHYVWPTCKGRSLRLHLLQEENQMLIVLTYFKTTACVAQHIGLSSLLLLFSNLFYNGQIILCAVLLYVLAYSFNCCILFPSLLNHSPLARYTLNLISDFHRKHSSGGACWCLFSTCARISLVKMHWNGIAELKDFIITVSVKLPSKVAILIFNHLFISPPDAWEDLW